MAEVHISVDVEASGRTPTTGSLVAIGACVADRPDLGFYAELRPVPGVYWGEDEERVHGLSRQHLQAHGMEPADAMYTFAAWIASVSGAARPVMVAFPIAYDWMWIADYFWRFTGTNPFGISGPDIKSYFMGKHGVAQWRDTAKSAARRVYPSDLPHTHNALDDAREQAQLWRAMRGGA